MPVHPYERLSIAMKWETFMAPFVRLTVFRGGSFLGKIISPSPKIVINLPRTYEKLH